MDWYLKVVRNYVGFQGRARRREFWMFALFNFIIGVVLGIVSAIIRDKHDILGSIYGLAVLLPALAVTFRRLHDTDRSGWWWLIWLIPVVGWIILIVFLAGEGTRGPNKYGPDPKGSVDGMAYGGAGYGGYGGYGQ